MKQISEKEKNNRISLKVKSALATLGVIVFNLMLSVSLTNVMPGQQGIQATSWNEIFIYARPFSVVVYVLYLLSLFEKTVDIGKRIVLFVMTYMDVIFLCVVFLYLALYEIYVAYYRDCYISPDSSFYMREAANLLAGNGFYGDKLAGYDAWFANWPIGYPALIAVFSLIFRCNIYLSSKLLSIALVGLGLLVLRLRFKKDAWIFSLIYFNAGFLGIYIYTWSENPFILSLIIWGSGLAAIVEDPLPAKRWYFITTLGILGACLTRYFGIVTILFTFLCLLLYILYYVIKGRNPFVLCKIKGLLRVEISSSVTMGLYLLMNRAMSGRMTGVARQEWWDDYSALIDNLYNALIAEITNATRVDIASFIPNVKRGRAAVILFLLSVLVIGLVKNYRREKKLDYKTIFIGAGIFYYLVFILVRFHSSMDTFSFRFFAPAGMMVSIGVFGLIKDKLENRLKSIQVVICLFLCILCGCLMQNIRSCTIETSAYRAVYSDITEFNAIIPSKGIILNYDGSYLLYAFRPDIMIDRPDTVADGRILYHDTMETIIQKYDKSDSIWIRREILNAIINDENYSDEIRNTFSQYVVEGADGNEYVQLH